MLENAQWVGFFGEESPKVRTEIEIKDEIESAKIEICGLGLFHFYINGSRVNEEEFTMLWSDFHKREITDMLYGVAHDATYRIYVPGYDAKDFLKKGTNTIAFHLGNGWYNQYERVIEGKMRYGAPILCYRLVVNYKNGEKDVFISDETLKWSPSHIIYNNIFFGEKHDLRLYSEDWLYSGFDDSTWKNAELKEKPDAILCPAECPTDKVIRTLSPTMISQKNGKTIYSLDENISGRVKFRLKGKCGDVVVTEFSEELTEDGNLDFFSTGMDGQIQRDTYISAGNEEVVYPVFTWHAFRYFSVEGDAVPEMCEVIHTPIETVCEFKCDNDVLNWIFDAFKRTQLNNMHMGVPSDCPHRERLGYTGDGQIASNAAMYVFNAEKFYKKWIRDILDCQHRESGRVQHTAPFYGGGGGIGGWGGAIVIVPYMHYKHYFDIDLLKESYPYMEKWAGYLFTQTENDLVMYEEKDALVNPDYWNLGEWFTPEEVKLPKEFINTYYFIKALGYMAEIARIIGADFPYDAEIERFKTAWKSKCFNPDTHCFFNSVQGADAFAIDLGLGDEMTLKALVSKYSESDGFDTGIFGTYILTDVLFKNGYADTAIRLMTMDSRNSFSNMMKSGATTLWESWDGISSHDHPMFGASSAHIFEYILGVRYENENSIIIGPCNTKILKNIDATIKTKTGEISVKYYLDGNKRKFRIEKRCSENVTFMYDGRKTDIYEEVTLC